MIYNYQDYFSDSESTELGYAVFDGGEKRVKSSPINKFLFEHDNWECLFCASKMESVYRANTGSYNNGYGDEHKSIIVWACPKCGWWHSYVRDSWDSYHGGYKVSIWKNKAILKKFENLNDISLPLQVLQTELIRLASKVKIFSSEELVKEVLKDFFSIDVHLSGTSPSIQSAIYTVETDKPFLINIFEDSNGCANLKSVNHILGTNKKSNDGGKIHITVDNIGRINKNQSIDSLINLIDMIDLKRFEDILKLPLIKNQPLPWSKFKSGYKIVEFNDDSMIQNLLK